MEDSVILGIFMGSATAAILTSYVYIIKTFFDEVNGTLREVQDADKKKTNFLKTKVKLTIISTTFISILKFRTRTTLKFFLDIFNHFLIGRSTPEEKNGDSNEKIFEFSSVRFEISHLMYYE